MPTRILRPAPHAAACSREPTAVDRDAEPPAASFEGERLPIDRARRRCAQVDRTVAGRRPLAAHPPGLRHAGPRQPAGARADRATTPRGPSTCSASFDRSRLYLFHIVDEIEKRGMPTELALLPMVESAFNPMAYSRAHASGLWQFIPGTGKRYELQQNWWYDGAARHRRLDHRGARLPAPALRDARRLAARARLLQLGRERGGARHRARTAPPACRPTTRA